MTCRVHVPSVSRPSEIDIVGLLSCRSLGLVPLKRMMNEIIRMLTILVCLFSSYPGSSAVANEDETMQRHKH